MKKRSPQLEYYYRNKPQVRARQKLWRSDPVNKAKVTASTEKWRKDNPETHARIKERAQAKSYGLTVERYRELRAKTHCDICAEAFTSAKHRHIDHCHDSKKVRGVLCSKCNLAIGMMRDNPTYLRLAADYIERAK